MMKIRTAAAGLLLVLLLSSCKPESSPQSSGTPLPEESAAQLENSAAFWHAFNPQSPAGMFIEEKVKEYNSTDPDYRILNQPLGSCSSILNRLEKSVADSTLPALAWVCFGASSTIPELTPPASLESVLGETQTGEMISGIDPSLLQRVTSSTGLDALPFNKSVPVIVYNRDLLRQSGLDAAFISSSWINLIEASYLVLDNTEVSGLTFGLDPAWTMELLITTQGGQMLDEQGTPIFNNSSWTGPLFPLAAYNQLESLDFSESTSEAASSLRNGSVGMAVLPYEWSTQFSSDPSYGAAPWPSSSAAPGGLPISGGSLYILSNEPGLQQAAADFMLFLLEDSNSASWAVNTGLLPARQGNLDSFRNAPPTDASAAAINYMDTGSLLTEYGVPYLVVQEIFSTAISDMVEPEFGINRAATEAMLKLTGYMAP